jgi:hypothetical protein
VNKTLPTTVSNDNVGPKRKCDGTNMKMGGRVTRHIILCINIGIMKWYI